MSNSQIKSVFAAMTPSEKARALREMAAECGMTATLQPVKPAVIEVITYTGKKKTSIKGVVKLNGNTWSQMMVGQYHAEALLKMEQQKKGSIVKWLEHVAGQQIHGFNPVSIEMKSAGDSAD